MSQRQITPNTTLDLLKAEAKRWLKQLRAFNPAALTRFTSSHPQPPAQPTLRDVQLALAREFGFPGWTALKNALPAHAPSLNPVQQLEQTAQDLVIVYESGDSAALNRVNAYYERQFTPEDIRAKVWHLLYKVRRAKGSPAAFQLPESQEFMSRIAGYPNWQAFTEATATGKPNPLPPHDFHPGENRISLRRAVAPSEWDIVLGALAEHRATSLEANGLVNDAALARIAQLDHVTQLDISDCRELTDDGLLLLARMPQLEALNLSEYPGGRLTDRGLAVLRHLPNLRRFKMVWQRGISDAGVSHLRHCPLLESVDLMGSPTGDGAIEALRGMPHLHYFQTGRLVTNRGLAYLPEFPRFCQPEPAVRPHLLLDGPFTNKGLDHLKHLTALSALDLFWHVTRLTPRAFATLRHLPNLIQLGCDGQLANDESMAHIAAIPRLKKLRAQGSAASDDGFLALAKSQSLEEFWGREAPGLSSRGFTGFAQMPNLRTLGVSLKNVDDSALALLPAFPALRKLTPIDVVDDGFRHIGQCHNLQDLSCMYCRTTGDAATAHIAGLQLKQYYAGLTQITDASLDILGRMQSLESIELYETLNITNAGLLSLASLPNLRELHLSGLPQVSFTGTAIFPARVKVHYSV